MKKLLLITLCVFGMFGTLKAQEKEVVIDGTVGSYDESMNRYAPIFVAYQYSISQQYYLAEEIGVEAGTITSLSFKTDMTWYETAPRRLDVFVVNTENSSFNGLNMEQLTLDDIHFSGNVTFAPSAWVEIKLDKAFNYTGGNILVCVSDITGTQGYFDGWFTGFVLPEGSPARCVWHRNETLPFDPIAKVEVANEVSYCVPFVKFVFSETDAIEENTASFNVYPNPVENELFIATEMNVEEIAVYDVYGRQALSQQVNETTSQQVVNVAELNEGVYFVKIVTDNGEIVKRFVKK